MPIQRFQQRLLPAAPWKNAGGLTREIVRRPHDAAIDNFDWRVSIAELTMDGAFSPFNEVDRTIVLLNGPGVVLRSSDGRIDHPLDTPLIPFAFSGDEMITASLIGGASSDFNVMVRRGVVRAAVHVVRADTPFTAWNAGVLFAAVGRWDVASIDHRSQSAGPATMDTLDTGDGIWWDADPRSWMLTAHTENAAMIAVQITSAQASGTTERSGWNRQAEVAGA